MVIYLYYIYIGNIFPLVLGTGLKHASPLQLKCVIATILLCGFASGLTLTFTWSITFAGLSYPLYITFFLLGVCASTSNVTHYTFVSLFPIKVRITEYRYTRCSGCIYLLL